MFLFKKNSENKKKSSSDYLSDIAGLIGILSGNEASINSQSATDSMTEGMKLFLDKSGSIHAVPFEQAKGNLFEYIEAAKFNSDAAGKGLPVRAIVTDAPGVYHNPHAPADILIVEGNKILDRVQAKVCNDPHAAVMAQTGGLGSPEKYMGMQRLVDAGKDISEMKEFAKIKADMGLSNAEQFNDVQNHLTNKLSHRDVSSSGTNMEELQEAKVSPDEYAQKLINHQLGQEVIVSASNMALASAISTGVISSAKNVYEIFADGKEIEDALKSVVKDVSQNACRGAKTGVVAAGLRHFGNVKGYAIISDSMASTVLAASIVDCGSTICSWLENDISNDECIQQLSNTTVKGISTVCFTKAIGTVMGASIGLLVPMVIYSTASILINASTEIIRRSRLAKEQYEKIAALLKEAALTKKQYCEQLKDMLNAYEQKQHNEMIGFINALDKNLFLGSDYKEAVNAINKFSSGLGITLRYSSFESFEKAILSKEPIIIG